MKTAAGLVLLVLIVSPTSAESWRLVWSDEFDDSGLPDPKKWGYEEGFVRNNEAQCYIPAQLRNIAPNRIRCVHLDVAVERSRQERRQLGDDTVLAGGGPLVHLERR